MQGSVMVWMIVEMVLTVSWENVEIKMLAFYLF